MRTVRPEIQREFHRIIREADVQPQAVLEVGGVLGPNSLLRFPELSGAASRVCLNLTAQRPDPEIESITGNANSMPLKNERFDLVMSNATLEHDKHFWLSLGEMRRVLKPGGLLIIGVPGYIKNPKSDHGRTTHTYRVHYRFDYYRFSEQAVREVFFEGMDAAGITVVPRPPRIIGWGRKPETAKSRRRLWRRGG
jgi:SAM-dependent methyltransferase